MSALLAHLLYVLATMHPFALAVASFATGVILTATLALTFAAERSRRRALHAHSSGLLRKVR